MDSNDDFQKIFGVEIILKFFNLKFEENFDMEKLKFVCEIIDTEQNLPNIVWTKVSSLADHFNYKISIFAVYLTQLLAPRSLLEEMKIRDANNIYNDDAPSFIKVKNNNEETKIEMLFNFIRNKIIFDLKLKNSMQCNENFPTLASYNEDNVDMNINKVDEVNDDIDFVKIPELNDIIDMNKVVKKQDDDDNVTLEQLGVIEVHDEIFENFDEENIPVIKNIYKRKKGSAEKFKTNQTARNLLMSNHNRKEPAKDKKETITNQSNQDLKENNYLVNNAMNVFEENKNSDLIDEDSLSDMQVKKSN